MDPELADFLKKLDKELPHYIKSPHLNHGDLAKKLCKSLTCFKNWVKRATGMSPGKYIHRFAIKLSYQMILKNPDEDEIENIAAAVGYKQKKLRSFIRAFKKHFHCTPRQLIRAINDK